MGKGLDYFYTQIQVVMDGQEVLITSKNPATDYPNLLQKIPKNCDKIAKFNRLELIAAIETLKPYLNKPKSIFFNGGHLYSFKQDIDTGKVLAVGVDASAVVSFDFNMMFNAEYLLNILKRIDCKIVSIDYKSAISGTIIDVDFILMPLLMLDNLLEDFPLKDFKLIDRKPAKEKKASGKKVNAKKIAKEILDYLKTGRGYNADFEKNVIDPLKLIIGE